MTLALFLLGLVLLTAGAELLVRGAARFALAVGLSPLVIGLTVVAFGTSAPELVVSLLASVRGDVDIALGNVVGSNIFNVLIILGASALLKPVPVSSEMVRVQLPVMIGVSLLALLLARDGSISRAEGGLLVAGVALYASALVLRRRRDEGTPDALVPLVSTPGGTGRSALLVGIGILLLVVGSRWLVDGARAAAAALGVSELVVGLTVVAAGTSLPELATSVVATLRDERDIAIGNILGSNIFNVLAILGSSAAVAPGGLVAAPVAVAVDLPVMVAVALLCLPVFLTGRRVDRAEGAIFLLAYAGYLFYLVRTATG